MKESDREILKSVIEILKATEKGKEEKALNTSLIEPTLEEHTHKAPSKEAPQNPPSPPMHKDNEHLAHQTLEELFNCPNCGDKNKARALELIRKARENPQDFPFLCKTCGLGVKIDEKECPTCKGTRAVIRK